ncbi:hypothetical protein PABG_04337 [Paracoccidioides brasiliensis Pb03]|nr:hypothetical protein PABG_04337 [Paracoccidioides brasiliensis Pb03]ODH52679.1 hypothetical protein GX48_01164 [Paracoccidioides brasiliensis]
MGAVLSCIQDGLRAIGGCLMAIVNGIGNILMAILQETEVPHDHGYHYYTSFTPHASPWAQEDESLKEGMKRFQEDVGGYAESWYQHSC